MSNNSKLSIRESDLKGDCFRLNQRFDLDETRLTILETAAPAAVGAGASIAGTRANRLNNFAPNAYLGVLYCETDTGLIYQSQYVLATPKWLYVSGVYRIAQSAIATFKATLDKVPNSVDDGLLVYVTDYDHALRWGTAGVAFAWGPNESNCYFQGFMVAPTGVGWKLADGKGDDGSAIGVAHPVKYLKGDGTTGSITSATVAPCLPDLVTNPSILNFGSPATGVNAAVAPTVGGSLAVASNTTGITGPGNTGAAAPGTGFPSAVVNAVTVAGTTSVATAAHVHTVNSHSHTVADPTDPGHVHSLTGAVTVGADGKPQNITLIAYFRK